MNSEDLVEGQKDETSSRGEASPTSGDGLPDRPTRLILEILRSFPCLRAKFGEWNPSKFRPDTFAAMLAGGSHGEILCGLFVLNIWNRSEANEKGWMFDLIEFAGTADIANRRALAAWLTDPTWP